MYVMGKPASVLGKDRVKFSELEVLDEFDEQIRRGKIEMALTVSTP